MTTETIVEFTSPGRDDIPREFRGYDQHNQPIDMRDWHHYANPVARMARRTVLICVSDDAGEVHKLYAGLDECAGTTTHVDWGSFRATVRIDCLAPNPWKTTK